MVQKNSDAKIKIQKSTTFLYTNDEASEKRNKGHHPIHNNIKNNKINKFNEGSEISVKWKAQKLVERNQRRHKQMERYPMFMDQN